MPSTMNGNPLDEGDIIQVLRANVWQEGTIVKVMDDGRFRVRSIDNERAVWTLRADEEVYGEGDDTPEVDDPESDTSEEAVSLVDTVEVADDGWTVEVLDDGSRITTSPTGRTFFTVAPTSLALNGLPAEVSYRTRGVQNTGLIARVWNDGVEDTSGFATCAGCGEETSVQKFPTKNSEVRLNMHRKCNSDRLASAKGATRDRRDMAN